MFTLNYSAYVQKFSVLVGSVATQQPVFPASWGYLQLEDFSLLVVDEAHKVSRSHHSLRADREMYPVMGYIYIYIYMLYVYIYNGKYIDVIIMIVYNDDNNGIYIYIYNIHIYIYTLGDPGSPMTAHRLLLRCRWSRCIMLRDRAGWGGGVGWGGVYYRSWNVDHVVDAPLQMITLYHAPRQGGVGWGVLSFVECWSRWCSAVDDGGVGCIIVRGNFPIEVAPWHVTGGTECRELEYQALDDFWFVNHLIDFDDCSMVITEIINAYLMMIYWNYLG